MHQHARHVAEVAPCLEPQESDEDERQRRNHPGRVPENAPRRAEIESH
jgi:hypothetical protein